MIDAATADVDALRGKHDARVLAAVLAQRAGTLYGALRALGYETDESLCKIFAYALDIALKAEPPNHVIDASGGEINARKQ
jgi:hypothetical protein